MIEINDTDMPITVAEKIITGTKPNDSSAVVKAIAKTVVGEKYDTETQDMFSIDDIKEIADYLMLFYENNKDKGWS